MASRQTGDPPQGAAMEYFAAGGSRAVRCEWVEETPIALEYNGLAYAVMMATPKDIEDFVLGFALAEGLAASAASLTALDIAETDKGWVARAQIAGLDETKLGERLRQRVAESSCGLCGMENLEALAKPLPQVARHEPLTPEAIFAALAALDTHQELGRRTHAAHAAAFCTLAGEIAFLREDVGRHNAMDKLIGAMAYAQCEPARGFMLSSARCSYEIVEKAARAGAHHLVTISLPTTLAVQRATDCGLSLWVRARADSVLKLV